MKKLYSLLVMMLVGFAATWAADETITFSKQGYTNQQAITTVSGTDFTITFDKGTNSSNAPKYYTSGTAIRAYGGNTFTVSSTTKTITTIEIGFGSEDGTNAITADADTYEDGTWTGSASSVTFTIGGTKGNRRIASIAVTYAEGGSEPAQKYAIHYNQMENGSVAGPAEAAEGANVTLTVTPDNGYLLETLTVVDENDAVINDANSNQFTMPASAVYVSATFEEKPAADGDVINYDFTGISGTGYSDWSGKTGDSGTVYAGNSGGTYSSVQLRSNNSNSGIIVTKSIGNARKVTVTWNSNTASARILDIYGSNTAYTAVSDLYNSSKQGTKIGSIGTSSTELTINDDYAYIGLRSNEGALYLDEIVIKWEASAAPAVAEPVISGTTPFEGETEVTITAGDGLDIYYTLDGNDPTVNSTLYSGAFTINATTTVKAIATDGTNVSSIASKEFELVVPITTLAQLWNEVKDLSTGASGDEVTFAGEVGVVYQNGSNLYVQDATGSALIYGSNIGTFTAGNVLNSGWSATPKNYNSLIELTNPSNLSVKEGASYEPVLTTVAVADIDNDMQNKYIKLENVNLGEYSSKNFTIAQSGNEITGRDNWSLFGNENYFGGEGTYNVVGFVAKYNNNLQIYPIEITAVDVPEPVKYAIEIDAQIVNGTVEADKTEAAEGETVTLTVTPATGYELEAITVLDGDANEVAVSANYTFEMPASDVIVSATFVEIPAAPLESIAEFIGSEGEQELGFDVVALGHLKADSSSGSSVIPGLEVSDALYIVDKDNTKGLLVYGNLTEDYGFGDLIPAGIKGTYKEFQEMPEMTSPVDETFAGATDTYDLTPFEATISDITKDNFGRYAVLRGATIAKKESSSSSSTSTYVPGASSDSEPSYTITISGETIDAHDTFKAQWPADEELADKYYDIYGICLWYKGITGSGKPYFIPLTFEEGTEPSTSDWVKTDATALKTGDVVVIAELTKLTALPNDGGASAPAFTAITLDESDNTKLANEPAAKLQWTVTVSNGSYQFKSGDNYLYLINNNNGVRVGSSFDDNTNIFTISDGYLYNATRGRYIGVYNTQDWRCYTSSTAANIKDQEFAFFKQASDEPVTKYAIEIDEQIVNGTVEADKAEAAEGETVSLTVTPAQGYELEAITVLDGDANEVEVSANNTFVMPASNVLVSATFKEAAPVEMKTTNATIVFVSRDADSSSEFSTLDKLLEQVEEGADYITAISDASKVYGGKNGLKLGTGSAIGKFTITLDGTYAAKKLVVGAAKYGSDAGNLTVAGNTIAADDLVAEIKEFEFELDPTVGLSEIAIATSAKRAYVKSIAIICEEEQPVETTDMADVTEAGEYVVTVGNVVAFDDDAQTVYTTDGQENWLPILIEDADLYAQAKAAATLSQIAGSFDASKTAPLFTATAFKAEGEFVENSDEIYTFDLADEEQELNPKAGQVIKIKGIWDGRELRAYSGANGGNRGRSFTVLGATDALVEGTAYSIPVAVTLKEAWDEEASTGAPKRVAKDGDAAFQNLQGKIVGGADMIEGVSTAVTDLNSDKAISGVQYINVAGQVSAEPFDGVNIVVTTYVDGSRSAVKVVR